MYSRYDEPGERIVLISRGKLVKPVKIRGKAVLSTTKIIISSEKNRIIIPLSEVIDAWVEGIISKKLFIESEDELFELQISDPERWAEKILEHRDLLDNAEKYILGLPL